MKKYKVVLIKSYLLEVEAEDAETAAHFTELYTSDIQSIIPEENASSFIISEIECSVNEVTEVEEIN